MASIIRTITVDCADPAKLARFWAAALNYEVKDEDAEGSLIVDLNQKGTELLFQKVPEGKTVKNRIHLDLMPSDNMQSEVDRLVGLGATRIRLVEEGGGYWTVLQDPEGNEFCVLRSAAERRQS